MRKGEPSWFPLFFLIADESPSQIGKLSFATLHLKLRYQRL